MKPVSPVLPEYQDQEVVFAKDQAPYLPLPALQVGDLYLLTRWRMTWKERLQALFKGDVYLWIVKYRLTLLQPVKLQVEKPR